MLGTSSNAVRVWMLAASLSLMTACGSGGSSRSAGISSGSPAVSGSTTPMIVNVTDAPSDRVIAFELTVDSVTLTRSDGSQVALLSKPSRVEVTHVAGSAEPLVIAAVPQGSYISASVAFSAPDVVYIDNSGKEVEKADTSTTKSVNVTFSPALQVGTPPVVLTIDLDAHQSLSIDPVTGNVSVNPVAAIRHSEIAGNEDTQDVGDGEFEHVVGQVTALSANSFTISIGATGDSLTFNTNSATTFEDGASATGLVMGDILRVEARTQPDGSVLAKEVELISANGTQAEGIVNAITGNPVTNFKVLLQAGSGIGINPSSPGSAITVNVGPTTKFGIDAGHINMGGLDLPAFSATTMSSGQRIEIESENGLANGVVGAEAVKLQQQALVGSISAASGAQFTLTVPSDSAFTLLTGKSTFNVFTQRNTELTDGVLITAGARLMVRGLVYFDPARGAFTIVAGRISTP